VLPPFRPAKTPSFPDQLLSTPCSVTLARMPIILRFGLPFSLFDLPCRPLLQAFLRCFFFSCCFPRLHDLVLSRVFISLCPTVAFMLCRLLKLSSLVPFRINFWQVFCVTWRLYDGRRDPTRHGTCCQLFSLPNCRHATCHKSYLFFRKSLGFLSLAPPSISRIALFFRACALVLPFHCFISMFFLLSCVI